MTKKEMAPFSAVYYYFSLHGEEFQLALYSPRSLQGKLWGNLQLAVGVRHLESSLAADNASGYLLARDTAYHSPGPFRSRWNAVERGG